MALGLGMTLVLTALSGEVCHTDADGYCTDRLVRVQLAYADPDREVRINTALGDTVSIELPPHVSLRNGGSPYGNRSLYEVSEPTGDPNSLDNPLRLMLWPKVPEGMSDKASPEDMLGQKTNLHLYLDSGLTVTVSLNIGPRGQSVQRLIFDFPERAQETTWVKRRLAEERGALYKEFQSEKDKLTETVVRASQSRLSRGVMQGVFCEDLRGRAMRDLLVVRTHRICRVGEDVFVHFSIHNRARDLFRLASISLEAADGEAGEAMNDAVFELETPSMLLPYDAESQGVAAFTVSKESAAKRYALRVLEDGGKKREVLLRGVSF